MRTIKYLTQLIAWLLSLAWATQAMAGTVQSGRDIPTRQGATGEFARLVTIPADCHAARELGQKQLYAQGGVVPGPACRAVLSCIEGIRSRAAAAVNYLKHNPPVLEALRAEFQRAGPQRVSWDNFFKQVQQFSESSGYHESNCYRAWDIIDQSWFNLNPNNPTTWKMPFEVFVEASQALLSKVRADYTAEAAEYRELISFNDRSIGVERLERAQAAYRQAFEDDNLAGMIRERAPAIKELENARARREFLMQQSAQLARDEQTLSDLNAAIDHESLTRFTDSHSQTALAELGSEVQQLSQTAPAKRGDISAKLEILTTRTQDIETAVQSARSLKSQAEEMRHMLVEDEGAARRILEAASSEELKGGAFDEPFITSANELIDRLHELQSVDLWALPQKRDDVATATRKLESLQDEVSDARAKYDRAQRLDDARRSIMQKLSKILSEFSRPEDRDKLSTDGLRVVSDLGAQFEALSRFDTIGLIARPDYSKTSAAAEDALEKVQQFKAEMQHITEETGAIGKLNNKVKERGGTCWTQPPPRNSRI
jgi:hypothetical protein